MKVVAISHSCVVDLNQVIFVALRKVRAVEVELIVPDAWRSEYTGKKHPPGIHPDVDFPVHALPVRMAGHVWLHFYSGRLAATIRSAAPDVVFLDQEPWSLAAAQVIAICRKLDVPCVCFTKQNTRKRYPLPFSWIERRTHEASAAMVALTQEAKLVLRAKGFSGPCTVLAHGYDRTLFRPGAQDERRRGLGIKGIVIGYMGRFVTIKGLDTLIDAMGRLLTVKPDADVSVLMVGAGPLEAELKAHIARLELEDRFVFAGPVTHREAPEYLQCMDIFVLPSVTQSKAKEQFGRVIVEAMACGVPVVGSSSGNIPDLIAQTGGGEVFAEGDAGALAAVLERLVTEPVRRQELGRAGAASVRRQFSHRALAAKLYDVLAAACSGPAIGDLAALPAESLEWVARP